MPSIEQRFAPPRHEPLHSPAEMALRCPLSAPVAAHVAGSRRAITEIIAGRSRRLLAIVGPCSIHDTDAAREYAQRLAVLRHALQDELEIVMRAYFEKPRTTIGWKGYLNDPHLDESCRIEEGLLQARRLLDDINRMGVPVATEFLDPMTPAYLADFVSWAAIGARTTESQTHRQMASSLSMPVGFKNGTDGNVQIAIDAAQAASRGHRYLGIAPDGRICIESSDGNPAAHVVLRGGKAPNFDEATVEQTAAALSTRQLNARVIIDASHANSERQYAKQMSVCESLGKRVSRGASAIAGVMLESHLHAGRQDMVPGQPLEYGKSVTDACLSWQDTETALRGLAGAVAASRLQSRDSSRRVHVA